MPRLLTVPVAAAFAAGGLIAAGTLSAADTPTAECDGKDTIDSRGATGRTGDNGMEPGARYGVTLLP